MSRYDDERSGGRDDGTPGAGTLKWFNATKGFGFVALDDGSGDAFLHISVLQRAGYEILDPGTSVRFLMAPGQKGMQIRQLTEIDGAPPGPPISDHGGPQRRDRPPRDFGGGGRGDHHGGGRDYGGGGRGGYAARDKGYDRGGHDRGGYDRGGHDRGGYDRGGYGDAAEESAPSGEVSEEMTGTVKWFKADRGFGFIVADGLDNDIFVHKSVLRRCGLQELEQGQRVALKVQQVPKGYEVVWLAPEG